MSGHPRKALKTSFRASPRSLRPIYTGGPVLLTQDGRWLVTTMGEEVLITEVSTGVAVANVRGDGSAITSLCLSSHTSPPTLITSHYSQNIRYYPLPATLSDKPIILTYTRQLGRAHSAPILVSATSPDGALFATGSSDGIVKVWDAAGGYATHLFRGHGGPVSALKFSLPVSLTGEATGRMELFTGSTDGRVRVFDLKDASSRVVGGGGAAARAKHTLDGHVSVVRAIDITSDGRWMVSGGRDKVVLVWDMDGEGDVAGKGKGKGKGSSGGPRTVQTIIAGEQVESVGLLPVDEEVLGQAKGRLRCWTGGDKGAVRVWDAFKAEPTGQMQGVEGVDEVEADEDEQRGIVSAFYDATSFSLVSVHADQNIIYHSITSGTPSRQIIGFNDEIIDTTFLTHPSSPSTSIAHTHLVLATNSNLIRLYSLATFSAALLSGHRDMVLCLDKSTNYRFLASGSKDATARIWAPSDMPDQWRCVGICEGHAESVGAIAFSRGPADVPKFLVTASQDRTIKLWDLSPLALDPNPDTPLKLKSLTTIRAHEKDINSLDVAPNDKFLASGSQDKLVKLFAIDFDEPRASAMADGARGALRPMGTCKGHRRGVWSVRFSKADRVVASAGADRSVRLWSLDDFSCLKTFEGHTNAVLRVDFLTAGMQLVTSASDGLVKLWNIRDEACVKTLDNHEDKIWALAIASDESTIVSAGADSIATFWEDSSAAEQQEKNDAIVAAVQSEQDFTNYLAMNDYSRAIKLALSMSQPGRLLSLFTSLRASLTGNADNTSHTGSPEVDRVLATLPDLDLVRLLKMVRDWNSNARTSPVAQGVLHCVLRLKSAEELVRAFERVQGSKVVALEETETEDVAGAENGEEGKPAVKKGETLPALNELLEGLIPYSQRHLSRMDKLVQESYALDYIVGEMDGGVFGAELLEV